jgi:hypothetical protein
MVAAHEAIDLQSVEQRVNRELSDGCGTVGHGYLSRKKAWFVRGAMVTWF